MKKQCFTGENFFLLFLFVVIIWFWIRIAYIRSQGYDIQKSLEDSILIDHSGLKVDTSELLRWFNGEGDLKSDTAKLIQ